MWRQLVPAITPNISLNAMNGHVSLVFCCCSQNGLTKNWPIQSIDLRCGDQGKFCGISLPKISLIGLNDLFPRYRAIHFMKTSNRPT